MIFCKKFFGRVLQAAALLAAASFILLGIGRGEAWIVLQKATMICFECIGLG